MSYQTMEVELDRGRVRACGSETLPEQARGLLTILTATPDAEGPDARATLADLVGDLAGIGRGNQADLSTNKAHLADFGR